MKKGFFDLFKVPPVTWSSSLQKEAEDWVKYLAENNKFDHSPQNPGNLYMTSYRPDEYCSDAIWWFHQEEKFYNYSSPGFVRAAGHFTQVGHIQNNSQVASETGRMNKRIKRYISGFSSIELQDLESSIEAVITIKVSIVSILEG